MFNLGGPGWLVDVVDVIVSVDGFELTQRLPGGRGGGSATDATLAGDAGEGEFKGAAADGGGGASHETLTGDSGGVAKSDGEGAGPEGAVGVAGGAPEGATLVWQEPCLECDKEVSGQVILVAPEGHSVRHFGVVVTLTTSLWLLEGEKEVPIAAHEVAVAEAGMLSGTTVLDWKLPVLGGELCDTYEGVMFSVRNTVKAVVKRPWWTFDCLGEGMALVAATVPAVPPPSAPKAPAVTLPRLGPEFVEARMGPGEDLTQCVRDATYAGARIVVLSSDTALPGHVDALALQDGDEVFSVSPSGLNRSQVTYHLTKQLAVEHRLDIVVHKPHAATNGMDRFSDNATIECFSMSDLVKEDDGFKGAFGEDRTARLGEDEFAFGGYFLPADASLQKPTAFFTEQYYLRMASVPSDKRHVVVAFNESVHIVLKRLLDMLELGIDGLDGVVVAAVRQRDSARHPVDEAIKPSSVSAYSALRDSLATVLICEPGLDKPAAAVPPQADSSAAPADGEVAAAKQGRLRVDATESQHRGGVLSPTSDPASSPTVLIAVSPHPIQHEGRTVLPGPAASPLAATNVAPSRRAVDNVKACAEAASSEAATLHILDCGGECVFEFHNRVFTLQDHIVGDISFSELENPILLIEFTLFRVELVAIGSEEADEHHVVLFQDSLLDVRQGGEANMPVGVHGGSIHADLDLSVLNLTPSHPIIGGGVGTEAHASVRHFIRLSVATSFKDTDKCWNTTEVILVRTADSIGAGLSGVGTTGTRRHGDSSFGADVVAGEDGDQ